MWVNHCRGHNITNLVCILTHGINVHNTIHTSFFVSCYIVFRIRARNILQKRDTTSVINFCVNFHLWQQTLLTLCSPQQRLFFRRDNVFFPNNFPFSFFWDDLSLSFFALLAFAFGMAHKTCNILNLTIAFLMNLM